MSQPKKAVRNTPLIIRAELITSAPNERFFPPPELPEVAFMGRSNCGKSSLLNALLSRKALARIGKTPGKTKTANFFRVVYRLPEESEEFGTPIDREMIFVDFPGFGYAKRSKSDRDEWATMIDKYLQRRPTLGLVLVLMDSRRDLGDIEEAIIAHARKKDTYNSGLILTKADSLNKNERDVRVAQISKEFGKRNANVGLVSVKDSKIGTGYCWDLILGIEG